MSAELLEVIEDARLVLGGAQSSADAVMCFAQALVQIGDRCVVGLPCEKHGGAVHGREAEELRKGVERLLAEGSDDFRSEAFSELREFRQKLQGLLDEIDARDSLAFLEATEGEEVDEGGGAVCE